MMQISSRKYFSKIINNSTYLARPFQDRVMTTSSWPVPYYNRLFHAYPEREQKMNSFNSNFRDISEVHWLGVKNKMMELKPQIYQNVENNLKGKSFVLEYEDIGKLAKVYVFELSQFIDVAHNENKRILSKTNLL